MLEEGISVQINFRLDKNAEGLGERVKGRGRGDEAFPAAVLFGEMLRDGVWADVEFLHEHAIFIERLRAVRQALANGLWFGGNARATLNEIQRIANRYAMWDMAREGQKDTPQKTLPALEKVIAHVERFAQTSEKAIRAWAEKEPRMDPDWVVDMLKKHARYLWQFNP
jgi:hypothetical protein